MPIERHGYSPRPNRGSWRRAIRSKQVTSSATICAICGEGERVFDPFEADHIIPIAHGGSDELENLRAVHRSCNRKRGIG